MIRKNLNTVGQSNSVPVNNAPQQQSQQQSNSNQQSQTVNQQ